MAKRLWEQVSHGASPWRYDVPDAMSQAPTPYARVSPMPVVPDSENVQLDRARPEEIRGGGRVHLPDSDLGLPTAIVPGGEQTQATERTRGGRATQRTRETSRRVCRARYAAVDLSGAGLIDLGCDSYGTRMLLAHRRGGVEVKAGDNLRLRGSPPVPVLWTTRHRYYAPGAKVTTLVLGVPDASWSAR